MKQNLLLSFFLVTALMPAAAQTIPNPGMETWTNLFLYEEPQGWGTLNQLVISGAPATVTKSTDKRTGLFAARLETKVLTTNPLPGTLPDTLPGTLFTGTVNLANQSFVLGIPFNQKVNTFSFWYKYAPAANVDSAGCLVSMSYYDTLLQARVPIADGGIVFGGTNAVYQQATVTLNYTASNQPDTILIVFGSSAGDSARGGSNLKIDDMTVTLISGIEQPFEIVPAITLYPNPATDVINASWDDVKYPQLTARVFDVQGKQVMTAVINSANKSVRVSELSKGLYTLQLYDRNDKPVHTARFVRE